MGYKSVLAKIAANNIAKRVRTEQTNAVDIQLQLMQQLVATAANTTFGKKHGFAQIKTYANFKAAVPIQDYEMMKADIAEIAGGKENVFWPGKPLYFCKSSGTTSGTKYIPVSDLQIAEMIKAARNSLMMYVDETVNSQFFDHKMIFLQGSPMLEKYGVISCGRLSGIVYNHVPFYVNANRMPAYQTNCIEDWEEKVEAIARETMNQRMSLISGIPPWCVMYFEKLLELTGKQHIKDIFPDFKVFAFGGVNYEPYRHRIESMIGFPIDSVETYPASEGFIAYQDSQKAEGMMLNINGGIFYEFIKAEDVFKENPERIMLKDVELDVNYALIMNTNAGLWGYNIGDTVKFVSKYPYRILVTGRIKHFISAFGEHVIGEEVDFALMRAMRELKAGVTEYTVAPQVTPESGLPYHEWLIEFSHPPFNLKAFATSIDEYLQGRNSYYYDLRAGHILQELKITPLKSGAFVEYMKTQGKLGGQNKVPRLMNDRKIADELKIFAI